MTSKNLFFKLLVQDFRKRIWCPLCIFILDFLALEVAFLLKAEEISRFYSRYGYTLSHYLSDVFLTPEDGGLMLLLTALSAIVCGISGYSWLHSRNQLDTYHSMPVKRETLYVSKYVSGVIYYLVPLILHVVICLLIGCTRQAFTLHALSNSLGYIGIQLTAFLVVYSISILAVILTGNLIISLLGTGILLTYSLLLELLRDALYREFYYTNLSEYNQKFIAFSPIHMLLRLVEKASDYTRNNELFQYDCLFPYVWGLLGAAAFFTVAGFVLYRLRPTEAAGKAIAFRVAEPLIKTAVVIPLSLYCGLFFTELSPSSQDFGWYLFGTIFGFLISALLIEIIFRMDIKCVFYHCGQLLFNGACIALIVAIFKTDALGYNTYVPSDAEIADCSVSINGLMNATSQTYKGYVDAGQYRMENIHIADNPSILILARKAAAQGLRYTEVDYYDGIEDDPDYQALQEKERNYQIITIGYHLKNGKNVYRQYYIDIRDEESLQLLCDIYDDTDYKANSMALFANGWNTSYESLNYSGQYSAGSIKLDEMRQAQILEAYQSEFMDLDLEEIMSSYPVATLEFVRTEKIQERGMSYYCSEYGYPVYPSFVRTIALLKEYGFDCMEECPVDQIDAVTVQDYTRELEDGSYPYVVYTDKKKIETILSSSIQDQLLYGAYSYTAINDKYGIRVGEPSNYDVYDGLAGYVLREGQLPDFVLQDFANLEKK